MLASHLGEDTDDSWTWVPQRFLVRVRVDPSVTESRPKHSHHIVMADMVAKSRMLRGRGRNASSETGAPSVDSKTGAPSVVKS